MSNVISSAIFQLHVAVLLFGVAGLMGKIINLSPSYLVLGRTAFGALALGALLLFIWLTKSQRAPCQKPHFNFSLLLAGLVLAIHWWAFFYAIQLVGVGIALVGFSSFPVFVIILETSLKTRRTTLSDLVVTAMVVVGLWLVAPNFSWRNEALQGLVYGVFSGALFAVLAIENKQLINHYEGITLGFWQQLIAALLSFVWIFLTQITNADYASVTYEHLALLGLLGTLFSALPHVLFISSLAKVSSHTAAIATSLEPVYGIALAWLIIAEVPAETTLAGMGIIIIAVIINNRSLAKS